MEFVDASPQFTSTSLSVQSPAATHIACLSGARLQIRCLATFEIIRSIALPPSHDVRNSRIAWSPPTVPAASRPSSASTPPRRSSRTALPRSNRILVFDQDVTRVYDLRDEKWNAVISNGSGGMGKNVHVDFGATEDEVLVWSDFSACLKIWCLNTGRAVEVRDPKFSGREGRGWGYRPSPSTRSRTRGQVLALLCRTSGTDVLLLLSSPTYTLLSRTELPTTDAAGLRWSPDGRWLAIWDAASAGYKLCIYTADGHLYRTITREPSDEANEWEIDGLGIKTVEWVPGNQWLAVAGWDKRVRILSTRTFAPAVFLDHTPVIHVPSAPVYTELIDGQGNRSYALTPQPVTPPKAAVEKNETALMKQGISILAFNADGTLCATRDDATPSTVWIWDLRILKPRCIVIQYAPVKSLLWHPNDASTLLVQTSHDAPVVYLYTSSHLPGSATTMSSSSQSQSSNVHQLQPPPTILSLAAHIPKPTPTPTSAPTKWTTQWLPTPHPDKKPSFTLAHTHACVLVWPRGKDAILRFGRGNDDDDDDAAETSDDSLFDILTGRTPVPGGRGRGNEGVGRDEGDGDMEVEGEGEGDAYGDSVGIDVNGLDDTFRAKRERGAAGDTGTRGYSGGFDESGLDEMF
ncbi:Nn.00g006360.m01.CDS01 [Neocucurbitaria sp. VM-36]